MDHPQAGLLLFETGSAEDVDVVSNAVFSSAFSLCYNTVVAAIVSIAFSVKEAIKEMALIK